MSILKLKKRFKRYLNSSVKDTLVFWASRFYILYVSLSISILFIIFLYSVLGAGENGAINRSLEAYNIANSVLSGKVLWLVFFGFVIDTIVKISGVKSEWDLSKKFRFSPRNKEKIIRASLVIAIGFIFYASCKLIFV